MHTDVQKAANLDICFVQKDKRLELHDKKRGSLIVLFTHKKMTRKKSQHFVIIPCVKLSPTC